MCLGVWTVQTTRYIIRQMSPQSDHEARQVWGCGVTGIFSLDES